MPRTDIVSALHTRYDTRADKAQPVALLASRLSSRTCRGPADVREAGAMQRRVARSDDR